ncbi:MAG: RidA family protein [Parvularculaceae bacterium]|nr:RidA family protein [Parvularculaceae bacterium]
MIEEKISALGLALPEPHAPVGNYLGAKQSGELLFVAARVSALRGIVGADVTPDAAKTAARDTMLQILAIVKKEIGDLDRIASIDALRGFVRSATDFMEQPRVIDGASDLLIALWGEDGRHARSATGVNALPFGAAVQIDMIARLK